MAPRGVGQHARVGRNQRVYAQFGGMVDRPLPARPAIGAGVSIDRDVQLATLLTDQLKAALQLFFIQIEAGEMARIGVITKAHIDGISALAHRRLEGGQAARRTDQLHGVLLGCGRRTAARGRAVT